MPKEKKNVKIKPIGGKKKKPIDEAHEYVDGLLDDEKKRLEKEYARAAREMNRKVQDQLVDLAVEERKRRIQVENGIITEEEFDQWKTNKLAVGRRYTAMRNTIVNDLAKLNQKSALRLEDKMVDAYAFSHNFGTWEMETSSLTDTIYTLYNKDAVYDLIKNDPDVMRTPKFNVAKDKAWNARKVNSEILQSIVQGESIPELADRIAKITDANKTQAFRAARTMLSSAENKGKHDSFKRAEGKGLIVDKQWISTIDGRTRDSHKFAPPHGVSGEIKPLDEPFSNGLMYPADRSVNKPEEIYNCRCTEVGSARRKATCRYNLSDELDDMPYEEWEKKHK